METDEVESFVRLVLFSADVDEAKQFHSQIVDYSAKMTFFLQTTRRMLNTSQKHLAASPRWFLINVILQPDKFYHLFEGSEEGLWVSHLVQLRSVR